MDNASKALIMAGAVLLAIMLITAGVSLYNRAMNPVSGAEGQIDALTVEMFNSTFINFGGNNVKPGNVKTLINKIKAHNSSKAVDQYGSISFGGSVDEVSDVNNSLTYTVSFSGDANGFINSVNITENPS